MQGTKKIKYRYPQDIVFYSIQFEKVVKEEIENNIKVVHSILLLFFQNFLKIRMR